jgi:hypothetical protein
MPFRSSSSQDYKEGKSTSREAYMSRLPMADYVKITMQIITLLFALLKFQPSAKHLVTRHSSPNPFCKTSSHEAF